MSYGLKKVMMERLTNKEFNEKMRERTKQFALQVIALSDQLPNKESARVINRQLLRSATSTKRNFGSKYLKIAN